MDEIDKQEIFRKIQSIRFTLIEIENMISGENMPNPDWSDGDEDD